MPPLALGEKRYLASAAGEDGAEKHSEENHQNPPGMGGCSHRPGDNPHLGKGADKQGRSARPGTQTQPRCCQGLDAGQSRGPTGWHRASRAALTEPRAWGYI